MIANELKAKIQSAQLELREARKNLPEFLSDERFEVVRQKFYRYAEEKGFYLSLRDAMSNRGYFFTDPQRQISEEMLTAVFKKRHTTLSVSIPRQYGKTEVVTMVASFCYNEFRREFGQAFRVCVIAPEKGTAGEVFSRLEKHLTNSGQTLVIDNKVCKETVYGDSVDLFGIFEGSKTTIEGRTYNLVLRDEAHMGSDQVFADQVQPTTIRTAGTTVFIGNGGFRKCTYFENLKKGNQEIIDPDTKEVIGYSRVVRHTYRTLKPYMRSLAKQGLASAKFWINGMEKYISDKGGEKSINVIKNVFCGFILGLGNFVTEKDLEKCEGFDFVKKDESKRDLYLGFDVAILGDRSIATFLTADRKIIDWLIVKDANETMPIHQQIELLHDYCSKKGYKKRLCAIGCDATGIGLTAVEFMENIFSTEVERYNFTNVRKHNWYLAFRDLILTSSEQDRLKFDPTHPLADMFREEMTSLEVKEHRSGYWKFAAPNKEGAYDDFVASAVIANDMRARNLMLYSLDKYRSLKKERHRGELEKSEKNRIRNLLKRIRGQ